jgi:hypothetical protein
MLEESLLVPTVSATPSAWIYSTVTHSNFVVFKICPSLLAWMEMAPGCQVQGRDCCDLGSLAQ